MNLVKDNKLMFKWSLVLAMLIAYFWIFWRFHIGNVPSMTITKILGVWYFIGISRWLDILIGPVWFLISVQIIRFFQNDIYISRDNEADGTSWYGGLISGVVISLIFVVFSYFSVYAAAHAQDHPDNIAAAVVAAMGTGCFLGFAIGHALYSVHVSDILFIAGSALMTATISFFDAGVSILVALSASFGIRILANSQPIFYAMIYCLFFILFFSLFLGLVPGLIVCLVFSPVYILVALPKYLKSKRFAATSINSCLS